MNCVFVFLLTQQRVEKKKLSDQIKAQRAAQRKKLADDKSKLKAA